MRRVCTLFVALSTLTACGAHYVPVKSAASVPADLPDASLVVPCDTTETDPANNGQLANELTRTRRQRDDCAARMVGVGKWRDDAAKRADKPPAPQ